VLAGFVALVLFVACTNLANLVLARGTARQREFAVRHALGASRGRLIREQFSESLLLAVLGAAGACVVFRGLQLLMSVDFNIADPMGGRWTLAIRPGLDATTLLLAAAAVLLSLIVFGFEPALQLTRDIRASMESGSNGGSPARTARHRLLLRWQVAVSAGFFIVATMFVKYSVAEARHDTGIEMGRLVVAVLNAQTHRLPEARVRSAVDRVIQGWRADSAIDALAVSTGLPFGVAGSRSLSLVVPGRTGGSEDVHSATAIEATPGIFRTLGVPILRGRAFDDHDQSSGEPVVVLSEFTARQLFGSSDIVGRQLIVRRSDSKDTLATVVGIARDTDVRSILGDPRPFAYLPLRDRLGPIVTITARSTGDAGPAVRAVREMLRRADPDLAVDAVGDGREVLAGLWVFVRTMGLSALALGALTLLLAMVGLFGIQSHIVSGRTREIGVRMSFGATAGQIQRMVLADGSRPVFEGLAIGLLIGVAGRGIVRKYMELDVSIFDPWMLAVVPIPLILAGFCAGFLPARRAAAIEPNVALRQL
jgi:predicted permease